MKDVQVRPIESHEVEIVERHMNFDWAASDKHRERLVFQNESRGAYLLAWRGDVPIGHLLIKWEGTEDVPLADQLTGCPDIEDLFVSPGHRSQEVGSQLLAYAEELARRNGHRRIGLGVAVDNSRARALYERMDYEDAGLGEYRTGGRYLDRYGREQRWEEVCNYLVKRLA